MDWSICLIRLENRIKLPKDSSHLTRPLVIWNNLSMRSISHLVIALAVVVGTPAEYALQLERLAPDRIVPIWSPYRSPGDWSVWAYDKNVRYPRVKLLWAHACAILTPAQVADVLRRCPNVWAELSTPGVACRQFSPHVGATS